MRVKLFNSLLYALFGLFSLGPSNAALQAQGPPSRPQFRDSILFFPVSQSELNDRQKVHDRIRQHLASQISDRAQARRDLLIVLTDMSGQPILPDRDAQKSSIGARRANVGNNLSFTFDSPQNPWTAEQLALLSTALGDFYPVAKRIYGPPAFNITVNVRKDPTISFAGLYNVSTNEMTIRFASTATLDVLCHEMFHAFRDDNLIGISSYEEGMARAAEIEVFDQLPAYVHPFDEAHSYEYDVYYEALNRPAIGAAGGNLNDGYVSLLLRYQLAGYAWGKALIENDQFLARFNRVYYDRLTTHPTVWSTEASLRTIAAAVQKRVEGDPFETWYARQQVLNPAPPVGFAIYQRIDNFTIDLFHRNASGFVSMIPGTMVDWRVSAHDGTLLDMGSDLTAANGHVLFSPAIPAGYTGRLEVQASAITPDGQVVEDVAWRPYIWTETGEGGIFGIVIGHDGGTVVITSLDHPRRRVTAQVVNGTFSVPSLEAVRGRFIGRFYTGGHLSNVRVFTKDASRYLVVF